MKSPAGWKIGLGLLTLALLAGVALRTVTAERRALLRVPSLDRRGLYERTLENATAVCERARTETDLEDRCQEQLSFLGSFPECDTACSGTIATYRRNPTR